MKKTVFSLLALFAFVLGLQASNQSYKIDDSEIDLLFENAQEICFSQNNFSLISPADFLSSPSRLSDSDKKIVAGILAITPLGALGVHRYYLGHVKAGVIGYLLPSVCFGLGYIPAIIDGVLYLISTDEEFNKKYRDNQKIWAWL